MSEARRRGHETRDASVRTVVWFSSGLVLATALIFVLTIGVYRLFERWHSSPDAPSRIASHPQMLAPPPQLQTNPTMDLAQYAAAQQTKLNSYGWIDKEAGVIHIPIARAMELIAQRGLPTRGTGVADASGLTPVDMQKQKAETTKP